MRDMRPLLQVMTDQKDVHRILLDISTQKKDVLIQNDVNVLNGIVQREKQLILRAKELEEQRMEIIDELTCDMNIKGKKLTFSKVIELCEEPLRQEFAQLKRELSDIVLKLKRSNELNKKLIQTHMDFTSFCIRMITDSGEGQLYNNKGGTNGDTAVNFRVFDQRV